MTFTDEFNYRNIFLRFSLISPSGKASAFTYQFQLMDQAGKWLGTTSGNEISFNLHLGDPVKLTELGNYRLCIGQYMRDDQLCGIKSAGIEIGNK